MIENFFIKEFRNSQRFLMHFSFFAMYSRLMRASAAISRYCRKITYFEVLGVEKTADEAQIKKAFRKKALELHPDLKEHHKINVDEAHRQFIAVRDAYEVLIDPLKRRRYVVSLERPSRQAGTSSAAHSSHYYGPDPSDPMRDYNSFYGSDEDNVESHGPQRRRARRLSDGFASLSWEAFLHELEEALSRVKEGPQFMAVDRDGFPEHMETEELQSLPAMAKDAVIMHIVTGQRLLGRVVYVSALHPAHPLHTLHSPSSDNSKLDILSLFWGDSLLASASRSRPAPQEDAKVLFYKHTPHGTGSDLSYSSELIAELLRSEHTGGTGCLHDFKTGSDHIVTHYKMPLVQYIHIFNTQGRYIEYHCSRAWLPSSSLWFLSPRDEHFDAGGWYLQSNKDGRYSRRQRRAKDVGREEENTGPDQGIDGSVPLLLCALNSLDRMKK